MGLPMQYSSEDMGKQSLVLGDREPEEMEGNFGSGDQKYRGHCE